jgi:RNA polymerase sigma-70 factor, ECF subfamily
MSKGQALMPETWVDQHGDTLFRYALVRTRDASVAEEIVQETLLAALQSSDKFSGHSSERTWLISILKHKIIDYFRKISRQSQFAESDEAALEHPELFQQTGEWVDHFDFDKGPSEWRMTPEAAVEQMEFWGVLSHCLSELPPRIASAFSLREIEQLSGEEICKVLQVSSTNLWVMLHRARAHLRNCLQTKWFGAVN